MNIMRRFERLLPGLAMGLFRDRWTPAGAVIAWHLVSVPAYAQVSVTLPGDDGGMLQWGVAAGIAIVICITGFLNSKRSHLH